MLLWELEQVRVRHESGGRSQERVLIDAGTGTEVGTAAGAGANCPDKPADCRALRVIGWHFNHRRAGTTPESFFMFPSMKYLVDTKIVRHCHCRRQITTISDPMRIQ
jgi:hypothetical protein